MISGQAERLMPMIADVLEDAGLLYKDLQALVTTLGPGAFTGLRIGLSTVKALAISLDIPLYGITTFQALALAYRAKAAIQNFTVIIETKRSDFYIQRFGSQAQPLSAPQALSFEMTQALIQPEDVLIGDGVQRYQSLCEERGFKLEAARICMGYSAPDMACVLKHFENLEYFQTGDLPSITPLYLREVDVSFSKTKQRVLAD
jgi:tRNA threonylcarbamoyladenosine biosynthesis protein TsaB